jgi:deoxyribodipyrimidine photolyase-like uncharacterized protein
MVFIAAQNTQIKLLRNNAVCRLNFIYWGFLLKSVDEFKNVRKIIGILGKVLFIFMLLSRCLQCKYDKTREAEETQRCRVITADI